LAQDYEVYNVQSETEDSGSFLNLYKQLASLRNDSPALKYGSIEVLELGTAPVLGFVRFFKGHQSYLTLVNFSGDPVSCKLAVPTHGLVLSSEPDTKLPRQQAVADTDVELAPHESAVFTVGKI
jgi:hypothetical protein